MKHEKYTYSQYQINKLNLWKNYLRENESLLQERFTKIIERYSNLGKLSTEERKVVELEFFHGSGDLNFSFNAKTINKYEFNEIYEGYGIIPEYNWSQPQNNDFEYPKSLDIYYEEFREYRSELEKWHLTFDWLVKNWVKLGGHKIGLVCGTWQNNAASTFSFNLINWDVCIELPQPESNLKNRYPLIRDLSDFEIESRIRFTNYEPFIQKFRYFEKDQIFFEIAYYANIVGYRTGLKREYSNIPFKLTESEFEYRNMRFEQCKTIAIKVDQLINNGFHEVVKPNTKVNLREDILEWNYGPFFREFEPINTTKIQNLENSLDQKLPSQYVWFVERMNNIKPVWQISNFRINHRSWKKFDEIYSLNRLSDVQNQLISETKISKDYLPIAKSTENGYVLINLKTNEVYYLNKELIKSHQNFKLFILDCTEISKYFNPMKYHLEKGNIEMINKWISNGIDITDESMYGGSKPIRVSKNYEVTELLCQHGANPNDFKLFAGMGTKYIKMLIKYGLDLKAKLASQKWFNKVIIENEEYEEIRKLITE